MNSIELPKRLEGDWEHAFLFTYSLDVPFFENLLRRQFSEQCRNQVILSDSRSFLKACRSYTGDRRVKYMNQTYVVDSINCHRAAHMKIIMLVNPESGRLLVGSGNLNYQGYASDGEIFTEYNYNAKNRESLNAFTAVRELLEAIISYRYVGNAANRRISYMLENTNWLFQSPSNNIRPVRNNLSESFLSQLQKEIGSDVVEELWILSPFFDERAIALRELLILLKPAKSILLVQPGYTSVKLEALVSVLSDNGEKWGICPFSKFTDNSYVHAKMYLLKTKDRAICLQGSPNLSQVAFLLNVPHGNIEVANMLTGSRNDFDHIIRHLKIGNQPADLNDLDLSYKSDDDYLGGDSELWHVVRAEYQSYRLRLYYSGELPDLSLAKLGINDTLFELKDLQINTDCIDISIQSDLSELLDRPESFSIIYFDGTQECATNPVFACNLFALEAAIGCETKSDKLSFVGGLQLEDEDLEALLIQLEAALVIDIHSIWKPTKRTYKTLRGDILDEEQTIKYEDIDYGALEHQEKIQQYRRKRDSRSYPLSRLQIILESIAGHLPSLRITRSSVPIEKKIDDRANEIELESEQDLLAEEKRKTEHGNMWDKRISGYLGRFIKRYLKGIRSPDFRKIAGVEIMAKNYVIFSHILWILFGKDFLEHEHITESIREVNDLFWGKEDQLGYFDGLSGEERVPFLEILTENNADAQTIASLYYSAYLARSQNWEQLRFDLRDCCRRIFQKSPFKITECMLNKSTEIISDLVPYESPSPAIVLDELLELTRFNTRAKFLKNLEIHFGHKSCSFQRVTVTRDRIERGYRADCLEISEKGNIPSNNILEGILQDWLLFEKLDYYRIHVGKIKRVIYDVKKPAIIYYDGLRETETEIHKVVRPKEFPWEKKLLEINLNLDKRSPNIT